jgi:carbon-monoxide dehydrogenase medium subunit
MIPPAFAYERAQSIDDALRLLAQHGQDAKLIAGGQSLLPLMKLRLARPERLIDIGRLPELRGTRELPGGGLAIGALTTYAELLASPRVLELALVADALPHVADVQVRNRGTIGGSIAHADPAADMPAVLLALGATVIARSAARGERAIPINDFFLGPFATALEPDELLTEIRLPAPSGDYGSAYRRLAQKASGFAIAGVAVVIGRTAPVADAASRATAETGNETTNETVVQGVDDVRVAVTGLGDGPYRASAVEAALRNSPLDDPSIAAAVSRIAEGVAVQSDLHADREYRAEMARVMARRAIEAARSRLFG